TIESRDQGTPFGYRVMIIAPPMIATTVPTISIQPFAVGGTAAYCHNVRQAAIDSLVHIDHNVQITQNVATVLSATMNAARQLTGPADNERLRPNFSSANVFTTTNEVRIIQNKISWPTHKNLPRSQNHCTACKNHVKKNANRVDSTRA